MARVGKDRWVANLHPRNIPVTKATLRKMLNLYDDRLSRALCCALAIGEDHPHFQEWLTKACFHLQTLTSFVYIGPYPDGGPYFTRRAMKLPEKYYAKAFTVASADGIVLYSGEAVYNASFLFFSSGDLSDGESYTLSAGEAQTVSAAQTGTVRTGMGSRGDGNIGGTGGMGGQRPDGAAPPSGGFNSQKPDGATPPERPTGTPPQTSPGGTTA